MIKVRAVDDINLGIFPGEVFGIIGMSGAGKSTLVRTLNRLEEVTAGQVIFDGQILGSLSNKELRSVRRSMAMIFQSFNLLMQKTVFSNVALPMKIAKVPRKEQKERTMQMLKVVGLENKASAWPVQLSGGQRQRVAIARALAMNPKVLLCDEATSALDPKITEEILALLKGINKKMKSTTLHSIEIGQSESRGALTFVPSSHFRFRAANLAAVDLSYLSAEEYDVTLQSTLAY